VAKAVHPGVGRGVGGGAPINNRNARKHGFNPAKAALSEFGQRVIDGRSALGRALADWRQEIVRDLGGAEQLSAQQHTVIDIVVRTKILLDGCDAYIMTTGIVNKRKRAVHPIVIQRGQLAESLVRHLSMLGLKRKAQEVPSLQEYLRQHASEPVDPRHDRLRVDVPTDQNEALADVLVEEPCDVQPRLFDAEEAQ
jgi:hypothetical protein